MAKCLIICAILLLSSACSSFRPGWIGDESWVIEANEGENLPGRFDSEGNYIPDNADVAMTYKIPDISAGFLFDVEPFRRSDKNKYSELALPAIQVELFEFDSRIPYLGTMKIDAGVSYKRTYIYMGKLWTNIFEISTGIFAGWNYDTGRPTYGFSFTIIKF